MNVIFQDFIDDLNKRNQTKIVAVIGKLGIGKSYTALRLCEILSEGKFNLDKVVFSSRDFLQLINSGTLVQGDCILWDEMSLDQYSRDFMSMQNKMINHVLTIFRPMNIGLFFTAPALSFVDIGVQRLLSNIVQPFSINHAKQINWYKWKNVEIDPIKGIIRTPFPRVKDSEGATSTVKKMWLNKSKLADTYEEKRKAFAIEKSKHFEKQILNEDKRIRQRNMTDEDIIEIGNKEGTDWKNTRKVMARFSLERHRVYRIQEKVVGGVA